MKPGRVPKLTGFLFVLACCASYSHAEEAADRAPRTLLGKVVGVTDGDTLTLLAEGVTWKVRLAQIDTPEKRQPYGMASKAALSSLVYGKQVRIDVVDTDRYGRSVGEVYVEEVHINFVMVRQGHAWAYTRYARSTEVIELEDAARREKLGLWKLPPEQREAPWLWRSASRKDNARMRSKAQRQPEDKSCGTKKRCKEMATCAEARMYLNQCGLKTLDGNKDGVPCEALCGRAGSRERATAQ